MKKLTASLVVSAFLALANVAGAQLYGIQPGTSQIVMVDALTGAVSGGFSAPGLAPGQTDMGLSGANGMLLYINSNVSSTLYQLNASNGAVINSFFGDSFGPGGLSYEKIAGTDYMYYSHDNADVHRQTGFGGGSSFFFTPGAPSNAMGGDGFGREFGAFTDGLIHEFNPSNGALINTFAKPAGDIVGMAFDGVNLYASSAAGLIYTLNANSGALLHTATVQGGALYGLGSLGPNEVPEPGSIAMFVGMATAGGVIIRRRRK